MCPAFLTQVARSLRKVLSALIVAPALFLAGCATNTETGAAVGAGTGAVGGAIIGGLAHAPLVGAAIGAGAGALTGAAIGHAEDKAEARQAADAVTASIEVQRRGMSDIAQMSVNKVPEDIIINQVRTSPIIYNLAPNQIDWLRQNGVSDTVIREMQMTAMRLPRRVYVEGPPPYVVEPGPVVGVGIGYGRRGNSAACGVARLLRRKRRSSPIWRIVLLLFGGRRFVLGHQKVQPHAAAADQDDGRHDAHDDKRRDRHSLLFLLASFDLLGKRFRLPGSIIVLVIISAAFFASLRGANRPLVHPRDCAVLRRR